MRIAPFAASLVIFALTLFLLGDKTDATQSSRLRVDPGGGSISKTAGDLAGTRRLDSPNGVKPGDDIISNCHGEPMENSQKPQQMLLIVLIIVVCEGMGQPQKFNTALTMNYSITI